MVDHLHLLLRHDFRLEVRRHQAVQRREEAVVEGGLAATLVALAVPDGAST